MPLPTGINQRRSWGSRSRSTGEISRRSDDGSPRPSNDFPAPGLSLGARLKLRMVDAILTRNPTMNRILTNWKTTLGGLATLLGGVVVILRALTDGWQSGDLEVVTGGFTAITTGGALIFARDSDKSSEASDAN